LVTNSIKYEVTVCVATKTRSQAVARIADRILPQAPSGFM